MSQSSFFKISPISLADLSRQTGAKVPDGVEGPAGDIVLSAASPLEDAVAGSLSFIDNPKYARFLEGTKAAAVFCQERYADKLPAGCVALIHEQPYRAYARALHLLYPTAARPEPVTGETGISPSAHVAQAVSLEEDVVIEAGAIIGRGAAIGRGSHILANAVIGQGVQIGRHTTIGAGASVLNAYVGDRVIIHPGARIGQDGFGFAMGPGGHDKVPQIGRVIVQDHVEIGANTTIDRGSNRDTVIGEGTKIDNQVQIGHNVMIGRHCIIVGLAGIAGSATLEDYVVIAGQVGVGGHTRVGMGAQIGGGAGTHTDIDAGAKVIGYPAMPVKDWVKLNMKLKALVSGKGAGRGGDGKNE
ncbi:MAG: UDP-3-O-(3-hydroxymyristoyl)glucosamine N-acyltransferase [Nitratireductor sp.]|nr:UDP-3-O-(3-hydroxymyristoyl)glucosamine N-acyltransferase [Nitratireductor sp.]